MRFVPTVFNGRLDDWFDEEFMPTSFGTSIPATDIYQDKDTVIVKSSLPGYKTDEVDVNLEDNVLTIEGKKEKEDKEEDKKKQFYRRELRKEEFTRSFRLPCMVKSDNVKAEFEDGILTITMQKAEEAKAKKINVQKKGK